MLPKRQTAPRQPIETGPDEPSPGTAFDHLPAAVLVGMVGLYWLVFGFLVYRQQSNFATFGFDIGFHDQGIWLLAHGHSPFATVRGLDYFAVLVGLISVIFVPFYWLGAGPHLLIVVHSGLVAAGAIPLWLLARDRLRNGWTALVVPMAYLLYPAVNWITWWAYHPDSMAITPLLFAYWLATRRKWGWFAVAAGTALLCKEDAAIALAVLGLLIVFWLKDGKGESPEARRLRRRIGLITTGAAVAWYVICTRVIIPWRNHGHPPFYNSFFPSLGSSIPEVLGNSILHPSRVWHLAQLHDRRTYYVQMFAPVAFLPILGLPAFLIGGPQFGVDITVQSVQGATIATQWASLPTVGIFLATVESLAFIHRSRRALLPVAVGLLAATSLASAVAWGLSPISTKFHSGVWVAHNAAAPELHTALAMVPANGGVSVSYTLTPHVTHRRYVYEFPNPWIGTNYGQESSEHGDPNTVQWLILVRDELKPSELQLLDTLTGAGGDFSTVYDNSGVVVAHRSKGP